MLLSRPHRDEKKKEKDPLWKGARFFRGKKKVKIVTAIWLAPWLKKKRKRNSNLLNKKKFHQVEVVFSGHRDLSQKNG